MTSFERLQTLATTLLPGMLVDVKLKTGEMISMRFQNPQNSCLPAGNFFIYGTCSDGRTAVRLQNIEEIRPVGFVSPETLWLDRINETITGAVVACWPRDWTENEITTSILRSLRARHRREMVKSPSSAHVFTVEWDAFRLRGATEETRGDVAVLVRHHYSEPRPLEGVGFFEAKRIYHTGRFDGIGSWEQLEVMRRNVPHHHVVLYDHEASDSDMLRPISWRRGLSRAVHCFALPTNLILALGMRNRQVYRHSLSLCDQLCLRYIQGFDLEFDSYQLEVAKGFINRKGGPDFLLVANVAISVGDGTPELPPADIQLSDHYVRLSDDKQNPDQTTNH